MKKWLLCFLLFFFLHQDSTTQNLVPNPSFEENDTTFCGIMQAWDFNQTINDWQNPSFASPDAYFTNIDPTCFNYQPDSQYGGVVGIKGTQSPRSGEVLAGIWVYTIEGLNQREYLQVRLTPSMVTGKAYIVSFYVSLADYMESSINNLGAHLSVLPVSASNDDPLDLTPQILHIEFVEDFVGWTLISDTIVAQEDYSYLTIGNFFDDDATNTLPNNLASGEPGTYGAYYFVDDVSVVETIVTHLIDVENSDVEISPNPVKDMLNITFPEDVSDFQIKIFNAQGARFYERQINQRPSISIDCSTFPSGIYFVQIESQNEQFVKKLMKY